MLSLLIPENPNNTEKKTQLQISNSLPISSSLPISKPSLSLPISRSQISTPTTNVSSNTSPRSFTSSIESDDIPFKNLTNLTDLKLLEFDRDSSKQGVIIYQGMYNKIPIYLKIFSHRSEELFDGLIYECKIYNLIKDIQSKDDQALKYFVPVYDIFRIENKDDDLFNKLFPKEYTDITFEDDMYYYHNRELFSIYDDIYVIIMEKN